MRELKFRAWFKEKPSWWDSQMFYSSDEQDSLEDYFSETRDAVMQMQYTGVKDTNGKEIYERDIVKVDGHYIGDSFIKPNKGEVLYDNGGYYIDYEFSPELCEEEVFNYRIEIIGHAYENKEEKE